MSVMIGAPNIRANALREAMENFIKAVENGTSMEELENYQWSIVLGEKRTMLWLEKENRLKIQENSKK
jgi:hypothetical protein